MIIHYDTEKLNRLIKNIFDLTGISISVLDSEYKLVTNCSLPLDYCKLLQSIGDEKKLCEKSDNCILDRCKASGCPESHICRAGLCDYAMPIVKNNSIVGYVIMGRIRSESSPDNATYHPEADDDTIQKLNNMYLGLPVLTELQLNALYNLLPSVLFDNAVKIMHNDTVSRAVEFIKANLNSRLGVELICNSLHLSQSTLYREFHASLGKSVNEYIIDCRIQKAQELLVGTDLPVWSVAEGSGIENYTYFCRLFKKKCGMSPTEYRKHNNNLKTI